jgi:small subunit ribosomal protein S19
MYSRSNTITKEYIGFTIKIHNGIRFYDIVVNEKMIGHKFGEFSPTRKYPKHKKKK